VYCPHITQALSRFAKEILIISHHDSDTESRRTDYIEDWPRILLEVMEEINIVRDYTAFASGLSKHWG